jgi:glycosyltransferase involved in cell wall biosynthesis
VICGDNSSLREIVPDERARFDSTSVESIGSVLDRALADEVLRRSLVDIEVPPSFNWDSAGRATSAVLERLGRRRERPRRPRVGIISPAPPQASGPATYLGRLIGPLADRWDVTLFTIEPPETVDVDRRVRVEPLSLLDHIERLDRPFDELVYFVGNSEHHLFQPTFLARQPGVVVLHDARLTGLYGQIQALRPDLLPTGLDGALATMYPGRYPEAVGGAGYIPADEAVRLGILMVGDVAAAATRLLAHSSHAADMVELDCGHRPEVLFELPFPEVGPERDPNLVEGDLVVSFGVVGPPKDPELLIDAVSQVPGVRLVFVGPVDDGYRTELEEFAAGVGVADRFAMTGHTDDDEYESWLQRAGVAVQLRRWSNGESSAAVNDVLAAGVPTIVSDQGSFSSLPDDIVLKLPRDSSPADLAERIAFLLADADARDRLVRRARAHAGERGYPAAASALHAALFGPPA